MTEKPDNMPAKGTQGAAGASRRPDDPLVETGEFLFALCRHEAEAAVEMLSPKLIDAWGGREAAIFRLRQIASPPNFPRLNGGITIGGNRAPVIEGDKAVVWLGVLNTRKRHRELNRVWRIDMERVSGRWRVATDLQATPYHEEDDAVGYRAQRGDGHGR